MRENSMEPIITQEKKINLLGCVFYGNPFHSAKEWSPDNEIGKLWLRFMGLAQKYSILINRISINQNVGYEIHIEPEEYKKTKNYYVFVGIEIDDFTEIPIEMFVKIIPRVRYIEFTTKTHNINKIEYVLKEWIPENGYEQAYPFIIEAYDRTRYKCADDEESEIDWLIPIKKI